MRYALVVAEGDSPGSLAKRLTGDASRYRELVAANPQKPTRGATFATLEEGEELEVPEAWIEDRTRVFGLGAFGTYTLGDVQDFLAAKDYQVGQMQIAIGSFLDTWLAKDSATATTFLADWEAFMLRYGPASDAAHETIQLWGTTPGAALIPDETDWNAILDALSPGRPATTQPTSFQGLVNRFLAVGGTVNMSETPQPANADLDLDDIAGGRCDPQRGEEDRRRCDPEHRDGRGADGAGRRARDHRRRDARRSAHHGRGRSGGSAEEERRAEEKPDPAHVHARRAQDPARLLASTRVPRCGRIQLVGSILRPGGPALSRRLLDARASVLLPRAEPSEGDRSVPRRARVVREAPSRRTGPSLPPKIARSTRRTRRPRLGPPSTRASIETRSG